MKKIVVVLGTAILLSSLQSVGHATTVSLTFTQLSGLGGGSPALTAVYRADVSGLGLASLESITIEDASFGIGGASGQFSGFDLDAVILSDILYSDASSSISGLSVFDYSGAGTILSPGTQRVPTDPKLFGTNVAGDGVDNSIATLGVFDGNATTSIPGAFGFLSIGDGGKISFNLTSAISTAGLYLYIGEVGDNGELAASSITVADTPTSVPEPSTMLLLGSGLLGLVGLNRRRKA